MKSELLLATARESPLAAMKTQRNQKFKTYKKIIFKEGGDPWARRTADQLKATPLHSILQTQGQGNPCQGRLRREGAARQYHKGQRPSGIY